MVRINNKYMMGNWGYYGDGYMMHNAGFGLLGSAISLVFWIVIIFAIVWAVKAIASGGGFRHDMHLPQEDSAMKILKERYAKGEIGKEEFEAKKKDLVAK